jgi:hypothetical protein
VALAVAGLAEADLVAAGLAVSVVNGKRDQETGFGGRNMSHEVRPTRLIIFAGCLALLAVLSACNEANKSASPTPAQKTFASPEDAGTALLNALKSGDPQALTAIFGADAKEVFSSGDAVKDKDAMQDFVAAYDQMHRWREIKVGGEMLYVGADNFVFPIPLGKNSAGQWQFDTAAGKDEILARRIGKDELTAITACTALAQAQNEYFSQPRDGVQAKQYAQRLISTPGKEDGLYWPVSSGQPPSPLEDVRDFAKAAGYTNAGEKPQPFDGYYFKIITRQGNDAKGGAKDYIVNGQMTGGFAILAYPADYRDSGIMTFIVGKDGIVYQKDLGPQTTQQAEAITEYNPNSEWKPAI